MNILIRWLTFWMALLIYLPKKAEAYDYRDYRISISEIGKIEKEEYAVLFYLPDCFGCQAIFDYILGARIYRKFDLYYLDMTGEDYLSYRSEDKILSAPTLLWFSSSCRARIEGLDEVHLYLEKMMNL